MKLSVQHLLIIFLSSLFLSSCTSISEKKRVEYHCQESVLSHEVIACYKSQIQTHLLQKISTGTRHLTISDWPFEYLIRVNVALNPQGRVLTVKMIQESTSRQLNAKIMRILQRIEEIPVPEQPIYEEGGFAELKFLIKPARSPILGDVQAVPAGMIEIMLPGPCATRSQHC